MITRRKKRERKERKIRQDILKIYVHCLRQHMTTHTRLHSENRLSYKDTHSSGLVTLYTLTVALTLPNGFSGGALLSSFRKS